MSEGDQLGSLLLAGGLLTREQLDDALATQRITGKSLGRVLIDGGAVTEADLVRTLAGRIGLEYIDLSDYPVDAAAAGSISAALSRRYQALPVSWEDGRLVLAMADPSNVFAIDDIRTITGADVKVVVATRASIDAAIDKFHRLDSEAQEISSQTSNELEAEEDLTSVKELVEDAPIVKLVNLMITQAVTDRASDIHIETGEKDVRVRYRIDGVLHESMRLKKNIQSGVISRLKIMADINIAERRIPQDGRVTATIAGKGVDLRVATLPTVYGEKVVMRILDKSTAVLKLTELGFLANNMARFERSYRKPYGTILVTGPTGSGKSTTLYATLNILNEESKNVITVEDPVEYRLAGINQVQVNNKAGLTFAAALRSILRSDPDIVLVGEIRDRETAVIAIEAALTGHLVLSTLHTNDAPGALTRLNEMGVEPFLTGSAVTAVLAQRLARKLCSHCCEMYTPSVDELIKAKVSPDVAAMTDGMALYRKRGCPRCNQTGYRGRIGIFQLMTMDEELETLAAQKASREEIERCAMGNGMRTLWDDGLGKVAAGLTSVEELTRVTV